MIFAGLRVRSGDWNVEQLIRYISAYLALSFELIARYDQT